MGNVGLVQEVLNLSPTKLGLQVWVAPNVGAVDENIRQSFLIGQVLKYLLDRAAVELLVEFYGFEPYPRIVEEFFGIIAIIASTFWENNDRGLQDCVLNS